MDKLAPAGGNWVTGEKFFNRDAERKILRENIAEGFHTLLTGQRRMGKTSLARQVAIELETKGWTYLVADLDACGTAEDMIATLATAVVEHTKDHEQLKRMGHVLGDFLGKVEELGVAGASVSFREKLTAGTWQSKGTELFSHLGRSSPCLVFVDELPNLLLRLERSQGVNAVELVLSWLRQVMQSIESDRQLVFVVSGSIGLEPIVQRLGLTRSINQMEPMRLKPWGRETASACLQARAAYDEISYQPEALEALLDNIGIYIPFHVQRASLVAKRHLREQGETLVTTAHVAHIYGQMVSQDGSTMVQHYRDRLEETVGAGLKGPAVIVLNLMADGKERRRDEMIAAFDSGPHGSDAIDWLFDVLVHDGYLEKTNRHWLFPRGMLRDWWHQRGNKS